METKMHPDYLETTGGDWRAIGTDVVLPGPQSQIICWTGQPGIPLKEARANARLIAAAGRMYNALRDVLEYWDEDGANMSMSELKELIHYALTKAEEG